MQIFNFFKKSNIHTFTVKKIFEASKLVYVYDIDLFVPDIMNKKLSFMSLRTIRILIKKPVKKLLCI